MGLPMKRASDAFRSLGKSGRNARPAPRRHLRGLSEKASVNDAGGAPLFAFQDAEEEDDSAGEEQQGGNEQEPDERGQIDVRHHARIVSRD